MNLYEHTIITRQDTSPSELKQLTEKYSKIIEKNEGEVVKTENWGLLNLAYLIKKNNKDKNLIGFCGGPFTVLTYMIEGGTSKNHQKVKKKLKKELKHFFFINNAKPRENAHFPRRYRTRRLR